MGDISGLFDGSSGITSTSLSLWAIVWQRVPCDKERRPAVTPRQWWQSNFPACRLRLHILCDRLTFRENMKVNHEPVGKCSASLQREDGFKCFACVLGVGPLAKPHLEAFCVTDTKHGLVNHNSFLHLWTVQEAYFCATSSLLIRWASVTNSCLRARAFLYLILLRMAL